MEEHPVIIIGAGPSGSACAKALKESGVSPLVIEKNELPRHKICSGILFGQTQVLLEKYFGHLPPESLYCEPRIIKASDIREWNREKGFCDYVWEIPKDGMSFPTDFFNVWRNQFDYWLLKESRAEYRDSCSYRGFSINNDKVSVKLLCKDESHQELTCSYLIGADGGNSRVRSTLYPEWGTESAEVAVYQSYYHFSDTGSLKDGSWTVFFEPEIGDTLSSVSRKDDFLTLCVGGLKGRSLKKSMEAFKRFLSENFGVVLEEEERNEGCVLRQAPPNLGAGRVILTGEAAGFMYLNGEGISAAIDSGYRAGKAVAKAIQDGVDAVDIYKKLSVDILNHMDVCLEQMRFFAAEPG
ncbi:FAD dependent oxidoreductase [uncultured Desulfobacterium sp.]|uniref:FAD dependent oxidoreductase n=1 Tax=uncultured Desulfobacterium sp. TaxID=201089 RepID=A0A445MSG4_9BACT|nr:FAD dependent oxidoreductase [uncultured Desulfobacterium sp.]